MERNGVATIRIDSICLRSLVGNVDHDFVGMHDTHLAADEFPREVWVGMLGVEKIDTVLKPVPLCRQQRETCLPAVLKPEVFTPSKQSGRPRDRNAGHRQ